MTRTLAAVSLAAALLAACKKSASPDCDGAGKAVEAAAADIAANAKDALARETAKRVGPAAGANIVLRCKEDKWSAAATDCVKTAKSANFRDCEAKLTKEQADKLKATTAAIEAPAADSPSEPPPTTGGPPADCAALEAIMTKAWSERVSSAPNDADRKAAEEQRVRARAEVTKRCADDKWSADVTDCFKGITNGDYTTCTAKLSPLQKDNVGPLIPPAPPAAAPEPSPSPTEPSAEPSPEPSAEPSP